MVLTKVKLLLVAALLLQLSVLKAQTKSFDLWHIGTLHLIEGDSLKGLLKYGSDVGLVQIKAGNKEFAFNYSQIDRFSIIDITDNTRRDFEIYSFKNVLGIEQPLPFETLLVNTKFEILTREVIEYVSSGSMMNQGFAKTKTITTEYFYFQGNQLHNFNSNKHDILKITSSFSNQVLNYAKENKLRFNRKEDIKKLFEYYYKLLTE